MHSGLGKAHVLSLIHMKSMSLHLKSMLSFYFWSFLHHYKCTGCCCLVAKLCPALLQPHGLELTRRLCPWNFSGKNTEWVTSPFPGDLLDPGMEPTSPALAGGFFIHLPLGKPWSLLAHIYPVALKNLSLKAGFSFGFYSIHHCIIWVTLGTSPHCSEPWHIHP